MQVTARPRNDSTVVITPARRHWQAAEGAADARHSQHGLGGGGVQYYTASGVSRRRASQKASAKKSLQRDRASGSGTAERVTRGRRAGHVIGLQRGPGVCWGSRRGRISARSPAARPCAP